MQRCNAHLPSAQYMPGKVQQRRGVRLYGIGTVFRVAALLQYQGHGGAQVVSARRKRTAHAGQRRFTPQRFGRFMHVIDQHRERRTAVSLQFSAGQVQRLNAVGAFIDRRNARIPQ